MVRIQELASVLMDRYGLGKDDAEQFVSQMFQLVTDELNASQKSVKIKGLGTFKVTSVNSRESVDVNTGDRIVISGRNKISFTPDVVMRDRVNRPFAQFETVVVNDGVDFSEIDKMSDAELLGQEIGEDASAAEIGEETVPDGGNGETLDSASDAPASVDGGFSDGVDEHSEGIGEGSENLDNTSDGGEVSLNGGNASLNGGENKAAPESAAVDSGVVQEVPVAVVQETLAPVSSVEGKLSEDEPEVVLASGSVANATGNVKEMELGEPEPKGKHMLFLVILGLLAVILVIGGFGIYYMYGLVQQRNAKIELLEQKMKQTAPIHENIVKPSADKDSACNNTDGAEQKAMAAETAKADSAAAKAAHEKTEDGVPDIDYGSDPRLRTGAYIIIGVEKTVEVRKGQTLESISKAYLGNGMECYVEALNSRKEVSVGDKLKIPKLKLKRHGK